jgi:hypothetical protein
MASRRKWSLPISMRSTIADVDCRDRIEQRRSLEIRVIIFKALRHHLSMGMFLRRSSTRRRDVAMFN